MTQVLDYTALAAVPIALWCLWRVREQWAATPASLDAIRFLKDITAIGKGRFAQRLAGTLTKDICPPYIKEAIEYVAKRC